MKDLANGKRVNKISVLFSKQGENGGSAVLDYTKTEGEDQ